MAEQSIESLRAAAAQFKKLAQENPMNRGILEQRAEEIETIASLMEQVPKIKPHGCQSQVDKKTKEKLLKTISICQDLINGREFHVADSEIDCIPHYLDAKSPTAAKKQGLVLKQRAKPIATMQFNGASRGKIHGKLYLGKRYKRCTNSVKG